MERLESWADAVDYHSDVCDNNDLDDYIENTIPVDNTGRITIKKLRRAPIIHNCLNPDHPAKTVSELSRDENREPSKNLSINVISTKRSKRPYSAETSQEIYDSFIQRVINDIEEESETDDDDCYVNNTGVRSLDDDDDYNGDDTVKISMKELLDLFEDEYFIKGKHISVDRLRKRLEHIDKEKTAIIGFSDQLICRLDNQICKVPQK